MKRRGRREGQAGPRAQRKGRRVEGEDHSSCCRWIRRPASKSFSAISAPLCALCVEKGRNRMKDLLGKVLRGERLTEDEAASVMGTIMDGEATPAQIGALLAALAIRGETEDEVVGFARTMRSRAVPLAAVPGTVDICGTGGDGAGTFNISTVTSFVVAACGVPVARRGTRWAGGSWGGAAVPEAGGLRCDLPVPAVEGLLRDVGWTFLFAPGFHASTRHAVGPRKELGVRTAFNLLGPLTNPARPEAQLVGVPRPEHTVFVARCLARL